MTGVFVSNGFREQRGWLQKPEELSNGECLQKAFRTALGELLLAAARQGSHIISIYVPKREHIDDVSAILFNYSARLVKYIGNWSIADLYPPIKSDKG